MPTKSSRARRWVKQGKAMPIRNDLEVYGVRLISEPKTRKTQDIALGIDPGKLFTGIGLVSSKATLFKAHLQLPFKSVTKKMTTRRILRRARRGRRINRNLPYNQRCHRQKRFDNRRQKKLVPSIRANKEMELRVVKELLKLYPVSHIIYERVEARGNKGFSPVMVGQKKMVSWLSELRPTTTQLGWQTSNLRHMQHYLMLSRNLLYTGLTRAKKLAIVIGAKKAIAIALNQTHQQQRYTRLPQRLIQEDRCISNR